MNKKLKVFLAIAIISVLAFPASYVNGSDSLIASTNYTETVLDWPLIRVSESYRIYGISPIGSPDYEIHKDDFSSIIVQYGGDLTFTPFSDRTKYYEYGNFVIDTGFPRTNYDVLLAPSWVKLWANTKNFTIGLTKYHSQGVAYGLFLYSWVLGSNLIPIEVLLNF